MRIVTWVRQLTGRELAVLLLLVVLVAAGAALQGKPPSAADSKHIGWQEPAASQELARDIFERVNDERAARGSPQLVWDDDLASLARGWSERMIESGDFEHSPDAYRAHPRFIATGENIAIHWDTTAETHVGLMRSEGHRHAILEPGFDAVGIGVVCRNDRVMWTTQIFGQKAPSSRPQVDLAEKPINRDDPGIDCP